jgi:hypothetical protein
MKITTMAPLLLCAMLLGLARSGAAVTVNLRIVRTATRCSTRSATLLGNFDRPFNGSLDNVRIYKKVLDVAALEQIRQADLKNEAPAAF